MQQVQAGSADALFDIQPSPANIQQLVAANDEKFTTMENGGVDQFMWFNTKTSNNDGALQKLEVRQAIQYAIDKPAVVQVMGGEDIATVTNGIFGPGINGHEPFSLYGDERGKAEKAYERVAKIRPARKAAADGAEQWPFPPTHPRNRPAGGRVKTYHRGPDAPHVASHPDSSFATAGRSIPR